MLVPFHDVHETVATLVLSALPEVGQKVLRLGVAPHEAVDQFTRRPAAGPDRGMGIGPSRSVHRTPFPAPCTRPVHRAPTSPRCRKAACSGARRPRSRRLDASRVIGERAANIRGPTKEGSESLSNTARRSSSTTAAAPGGAVRHREALHQRAYMRTSGKGCENVSGATTANS